MERPKLSITVISLTLVVLLSCGLSVAQTGLATIRGDVTDASGGVVPGLEITVTEVGTNVPARVAISRDNGSFEMPDLKPGTYRLTAELPGFKTFVAENLILGSGEIRRVDIELQVGAVSEQITVAAGASAITTDSGAITEAINEDLLKDTSMPQSYPSPFAVMSTLPGIQGRGWQVTISGQSNSQMTNGFDGVANDRTGGQHNNLNFFQEITVQSVNATADSSRVGSYNMTSKSGANDFHGMVYYKHWNAGLDARKYFDPVRNPNIQHEYQAEASGPIIKDKLFFYASWMVQQFPLGSTRRSTHATQLMRNGDFSELLPDTQLVNPWTGEDFPNNQIPSDMFDPTALKMQNGYVPVPNLEGLTQNYYFTHNYPSDLYRGDWPFVRIDYNVTENNTLYGRWLMRKTPYVLARNAGPQYAWTRVRNHQQTVISDTHVFSPGVVNTFKFGWAYDSMKDGFETDGYTPIKGNDVVQEVGLQGVNPQGLNEQGFPRHDFSGYQSLETIGGGIKADNNNFTIDNGTTWAFGQHVMKFGVQIMPFENFNGGFSNDTYGRYRFDGRFTGNSYADFLLGIPYRTQRLIPFTNRLQTMTETGLYFTDSFKVSQKLTIDFGLRWDRYSSPVFEDGQMYNWNPATGDVVVPQDQLSNIHPLYPDTISVVGGDPVPKADNGNFRPRFGFAYRMQEDLVIRGGYGQFTERIGYFSRVQGGGPFELGEDYRNSFVNGEPLFRYPSPWPEDISTSVVPSQSISGYPDQTKEGTIHQFNLSVEKRINDIGLRASYVGARNRGMNYSLNINKPQASTEPFDPSRRPFPEFVGTTFVREDGDSNYDSLQLQVEKKVGDLVFNVHWTWANNMVNYLNTEDPYNVTSNWARDARTRRQRAVLNLTWDLPFGRGRQYGADVPGVANAIVGGWRANWISILATGEYFSPSFSGSDPSNTDTSGGLPDRIGDGNISNPDPNKWFDATAFAVPEEGGYGNSGVNVLEGQGMNVHHLSLAKTFNITERFRLTYTASFSNLFNTPHFDSIRTDITASGPGEYTSVHSEFWAEKASHRRIVMLLRLEF